MKFSQRKGARWFTFALGMVACLVLASCATGYGDLGGYASSRYPARDGVFVGTVQRIDRRSNRIVLAPRQGRGHDGRGQRIVVYNRHTELYYRGGVYPVEGLEPGDVIRVAVRRARNHLLARSIDVVHNVRAGRRGDPSYRDAVWRGTVLDVNPRAQLISLRTRRGRRTHVRFNRRTVVTYAARRYQPRNLQRGDIIRIRVRRYANQWLAKRIQVLRDATP